MTQTDWSKPLPTDRIELIKKYPGYALYGVGSWRGEVSRSTGSTWRHHIWNVLGGGGLTGWSSRKKHAIENCKRELAIKAGLKP